MSRRESCVWHPMPDEVRRSSVQSRRASLAAGRRKNTKDEPDWEVEAPPTPPADDFSPRQEVAQHQQQEEKPAAEPTHEPIEEEVAATREVQEEPVKEEPAAAQEAAQEEEPAKQEEEQQPQQEEEQPKAAEEEAPVESTAAVKEVMKGKTRHTVRFRGDCWGNLSDQEALEAAFKADVEKAAKVKPEELNSLNFKVQAECMVAEFILYHPKKDKSRMATVHKALQEYDFPQVCALYP